MSCGSFGSGLQRRDGNEMRVDFRVRIGDQAFLRMSRKIVPEVEESQETFG